MRRSTRRRQARPPAADAPGARPTDAQPWPAANVQIIAIFLVAISVRAVHFWAMRDSSIYEVRVGDAWQYDRWAADIADGQWIGNEVFYQTPLYPYALATLFAVLGRDAWLVRIGQAMASSIACVLLARAASRFFDARVGWVTGLMMAFYPPAIFFDGILQKASLDLLLTSLLLWLLSICRSRPTPIAWLAVGAATGLFTLNRENAVVLAPVLLAWAAWLCWSMSFSALAVRLGAMLLGGAIVLVPVGLRNLYVGGEFLLTTSQLGPNFYIGNHIGANGRYVPLRPYRGDARFERSDARDLAEQHRGRSLSPAEVSTYWLARTLREIREQPANWLRLIAWKALLTIHSLEIVDAEGVRGHATDSVVLRCLLGAFHFGVLCPLAVAGVWFTRSRLRELWILHALLLAFAGGVILFYVFARYRYPLVPMSMLFAAAGLVAGYDLYRAFDRPARRELFIGIALAGASALVCNWPLDASLNSDAETTWIGVGTAFTDAGRPREAIGALQRALAIRESAAVYNNLGLAYRAAGNRPEARRYLQLALDLDPNLPATRRVLGSLCEQLGDSAAAIEHLKIASALEPESARAHAELGRVLSAHGRIPEAIEQLRVATSLEAAAFDAANNLAWILATAPDQQVRNPEEAVELARHVCEAVDSSSAMLPSALDTLAAAYAAAGHFDLAVDTITKAIDLARSRHSDPMALEMEQRRRLYVTQSPYTDDSLKAK